MKVYSKKWSFRCNESNVRGRGWTKRPSLQCQKDPGSKPTDGSILRPSLITKLLVTFELKQAKRSDLNAHWASEIASSSVKGWLYGNFHTELKFQLSIPTWKKTQLDEKFHPGLKIFQPQLKYNSLV